MKKLVIIGGGAAGMTFAAQVIKFSKEYKITIIEKGNKFGWAGCPTPYYIGGVANDNCLGTNKDTFTSKGINILDNTTAISIDKSKKEVLLQDNTKVIYDKLVLCMGAKSIFPPIENLDINLNNLFKLSFVDDAIKIKKYLDSNKIMNATIIGAGFVGLEMAENLAHLGIKVNLVEMNDSLFPKLDQDLLKGLYKEIENMGVNLKLCTKCTKFNIDNNVINEVITDKETFETDFVLVSTGVTPNLDCINDLDLDLIDSKFIKVNDLFETSIQDIYALGDLIKVNHQLTNKLVYSPLGDVADKQAIYLAKTLTGHTIKYKGVYGGFATQFGTRKIAHVGLSLQEALDEGINADSTTISGVTKTGSFKGQGGGMMHLVYEKDSNIVIGATMIGDEAIAQFVDSVSVAIYSKLSIEDFLHIDYCYSPTNSSVWNPLLASYRRVMK